ncbi:hypothetical protein Q3O60_00670 [Alkalimonas collagenimarina]|uniref:Yip1 domain-containing protein n=1 Tax=Alkalimonas collagenimarina TaxID=400390 RepID=A0ABT9GUH7_9GAMM|nr:hypothetical protein [Alkalimonas collagenimarina]MDP4534706.1 hypothetical protein [Alkalimonas collagenimarina]
MNLKEFTKIEYSEHRWDYFSFFILTILLCLASKLVELAQIDVLVSFLAGEEKGIAKEIREAPMEHFAPNTIAYSLVFLYIFTACIRICLGSEHPWLDIIKAKLIAPIIKFYKVLSRAMIGGLLGYAVVCIFYCEHMYALFFVLACFYPVLFIVVVNSFQTFLSPIEKLPFSDRGHMSRLVGFIMIFIIPIAVAILYYIELGLNALKA